MKASRKTMSSTKKTLQLRLLTNLLNWPAQTIVLLILLLLVGTSSSWRVLDSRDQLIQQPNFYKDLTRANGSSSQLSDSFNSSSGWRFTLEQADGELGAGPLKRSNKLRGNISDDANIVSLNRSRQVDSLGQQPKSTGGTASIEWDDENATSNDDERAGQNELFREFSPKRVAEHNSSDSTPSLSFNNLPSASNLIDSPQAARKFSLKHSRTFMNSISNNKLKRVLSPYQLDQLNQHKKQPTNHPENNEVRDKQFDASNLHFNRLISSSKLTYHGPLANGTHGGGIQKRLVAGIEVHIDTHEPVAISRQTQFSVPLSNGSSGGGRSSEFMFRSGSSGRVKGLERDFTTTTTSSNLTSQRVNELPPSTNLQEQSASSSDWRPIVVASTRTRRSGKIHNNNRVDSNTRLDSGSEFGPANKHKNELKVVVPVDEPKVSPLRELEHSTSKWKPIAGHKQRTSKRQSEIVAPGGWTFSRSNVVGAEQNGLTFQTLQSGTKRDALEFTRKIEQPFDRDDEFDLDQRDSRTDNERKRIGAPNSWTRSSLETKQTPADRWTPLETTTSNSDLLLSSSTTTTTTVASVELPTTHWPVNSNGTASNSSSEAAQRSASDLSYVYSSQSSYGSEPVQQQQSVGSAGLPYYGQSYGQQPQGDLPPPITSTIIDTTSGQTPEMVPDRAFESSPVRASYGSFSDLQTVSFPAPAQAPTPSRQPPSYYGNYGTQPANLGFDSSSSYQQPSRTSVPQPTQPMRQSLSVSPQVVRQEHHYHYYNQPTPASANDRQQSLSSTNLNQQAQQPTLIRELQPIMISQPAIIQQVSSTTQAPAAPPQIIREIIKEVPVQTVQVQPLQMPTRFIQSPPPPPIPVIPPPVASLVRDLGSSSDSSLVNQASSYGLAPAKRFMRQLSESMPQVAIRMPAQTQFRLQMPAIQLATPPRISAQPVAGVTRQTGSFIVPPRPKKTTTLMTETQEIPLHTTIIHSTQYTPATRTTVYTTDHQTPSYRK